jgi:hypothetical protein
MYRGQYRLGDEVPLSLQTVDANGAPTAPDAAPYADIWNGTTKIKTVRLPILEKYRVTGLFQADLRLSSEFAAGPHRVVYRYTISSAEMPHDVDYFEIVGGDSGDGPVIAMHTYQRPEALVILQERASGKIVKGRNPQV